MLNNIKILRKKFGFSILLCKKLLEKNQFNLDKTFIHIYNFNKKIFNKNYKNYIIIDFEVKEILFIYKIKFNSIIIKNSIILKKLIEELKLVENNIKKINNIFSIYSIKLNENLFIEKFIWIKKKNIQYYNHNNNIFCLIKFSDNFNKTICYQIIYNKINLIKIKRCKFTLIFQESINEIKIEKEIFKNILFIYLINKNNVFFYYE